jgi:hypothetical protein
MGQPITGSREPADEAASEHLGNPWLPNKQPEGTLPDVREALNEAPDPTPRIQTGELHTGIKMLSDYS